MYNPNNAKDLMALACVAFANKDFSGAGDLFAQAMSLHDSEQFVDSLLADNFSLSALASTIEDATDAEDDDLASIASTLSFSMSSNFRQSLKDSLMEEDDFEELSESGCSKHKSQSEDDVDEDEEEEDLDEDEDEEDISDLESESKVLFKPVQSSIILK